MGDSKISFCVTVKENSIFFKSAMDSDRGIDFVRVLYIKRIIALFSYHVDCVGHVEYDYNSNCIYK